jgi:3-hydroxyacyl-CoA dehydrogenase
MSADYSVQGRVAVIALNHPPINGLFYQTRRCVLDGLDRALADEAVAAVVVMGAGKLFSGGADIREFGSRKGLMEPSLHAVIAAIEASAKPVVAAIQGICLGGGLELALGCHYRIAVPSAQIGLPEVKLGLLPGAGGTQRLPRAAGLETALNMILSGEAVPAQSLADGGLFDRLVAEDELPAAALQFAEAMAETAAAGGHLPRLRDRAVDHPQAEAFLQFARQAVRSNAGPLPAPARCVDAVAASVTQPFDEGLRLEREHFLHLVLTPESKALRHAFFAERAAAKVADLPEDTPVRRLQAAAVIGAGTMGSGIAINFLNAGLAVTLVETGQEALERGVARIRAVYESAVKKGKLAPEAMQERLGRLQPRLDLADAAAADIAVEAVFEDMDVKRAVFEALDRSMKEGAILATNTSTLDVNRIAGFTRRPQDMIGLHFFSPAHVMKLLEVVRGARTAPDVLATAMQLARRMKKTPVVAGVCDGFIGNRMVEQYFRQAFFLLEEGCTPAQVDGAAERFGFAMGPFRMSDLAGNDIGWAIRKRRAAEHAGLRYAGNADRLCEMGRMGQKTGAGWYDYRPGERTALDSPAVHAMLEQERQAAGVAPRAIGDEEIVQRLVYALVNEGARLLDEGIAQRASDIDVVYLAGYGFPVWRGGPMCHADAVGLPNVLRSMRGFARNPHADPAFWEPAPLLARLAADGAVFNA